MYHFFLALSYIFKKNPHVVKNMTETNVLYFYFMLHLVSPYVLNSRNRCVNGDNDANGTGMSANNID